jgi:hypothetical protein
MEMGQVTLAAKAGQISWYEHQLQRLPGRGGKRSVDIAFSMAAHRARS